MVPVVLGHLSKTTDTFRYSLWPSVVSGDSSHFGTISNICLNFSSNQQEAAVSHCFADISQNSWLSSCCEVNYSGAEQTHSAESSSSFIHAGEPGRGGGPKEHRPEKLELGQVANGSRAWKVPWKDLQLASAGTSGRTSPSASEAPPPGINKDGCHMLHNDLERFFSE